MSMDRQCIGFSIALCLSVLFLAPMGCVTDSTASLDEVPDEEVGEATLETAVEYENTRPFDQYTWLTTHNSFTNYEDSNWSMANQTQSIQHQLQAGVRGLMLDVHYWDAPTWLCVVSFGADCYSPGVYLCHGGCGDFAGFTYALPRQSFAGALTTVRDFLNANPTEVVTIFLEDYVSNSQLNQAIDQVANIRSLLFDPGAAPWTVTSNGWPTLGAMRAANKRLLIYTSNSANAGNGIVFDQTYNAENFWSLGDMGTNMACNSRWGNIPLNKGENGWRRLFVMNQFRNAPTVGTAAEDNAYGKLNDRVYNYCAKPESAGRLPNYVAVDFSTFGNAQQFVNDLNARRANTSTLVVGEELRRGQRLRSGDSRFEFRFQSDSNLVLYTNTGGVLWASNTVGVNGDRLIMQADGNLVMYRADGLPVWATGTYSSSNWSSWFTIQSDGNLVIYRGTGGATWASNTCCH